MNTFRKNSLHRIKFNIFKLSKLPLAYVAGLRIISIQDDQATVRIGYNYWTKNPFQSMYFAAQAMAAELSTGVLVMDQVNQQPAKLSMLVLNMQASFTKKAKGIIHFTCKDGHLLANTIQQAMQTNEGQTITIKSIGKDSANDIVSEFLFTWTIKRKV